MVYVYLDQVMPDKFGVARPCCFCLKKDKKKIGYNYERSSDEEAGVN